MSQLMGNPFNVNFQIKSGGQQAAVPQPSLTMRKLFPTVIWEAELAQFQSDLDGWKRELEQLRAAEPRSAGRSTRSGWHSEDRAVLAKPSFAPLSTEIERLVAVALSEIAGEELAFKLSSWVNIHDPGGFNMPHMHANALLSGVFYLSVPPGAGTLLFRDPRPGVLHSPHSGGGPNAHKIVGLEPRAGLLVLIPNWLEHWVEPHKGDEPRISIAFNVTPGRAKLVDENEP